MLWRTVRIVPQLALAALAWTASGTATAETIFGCLNKSNGGVRIVAEGIECLNSELPVSWSTEGIQGPPGPEGPTGPAGATGPAGPPGAGVKTISGIVGANGSVVIGNGFTATRLEAGRYEVRFPAETWPAFPLVTVSPFGISGSYGIAVVASIAGFGDGSATVQVVIANPAQNLFDNAFIFIAVQSQ